MIKIKILTIAWGHQFINSILNKTELNEDFTFYHYLHDFDYSELLNIGYDKKKLFKTPNEFEIENCDIDKEYLTELEIFSNFTINNLIISDRIARNLEYSEVLKYACALAKKFEIVYDDLKPLYVLGSWDSLIQGIAMLVAQKKGIPFYIMKFSVIPSEHVAICNYPKPNHEIEITNFDIELLKGKANKVLSDWETKIIVAPAYVSAKTYLDIIKRLPVHFKEIISRIYYSLKLGKNKFTSYSYQSLFKQYLRKKKNILFMSKKLFINNIPNQPFFFYGLHMQPESSIDVMAPFYSNQFQVIESISRSMPTKYLLLIKIHVSDADNYSKSDLKQLLKIPGVKVVSPFVSSREFIENATMLFSIQGTIGLEGALLGKPTIMFGDSPVVKFPSVSKVNKIEELPELVIRKLHESPPTREMIIGGFSHYLKNFLPSCSDDWVNTLARGLTIEEVQNFKNIFGLLNKFALKER
jgi:hypothetical protein